MLVIRLLRLTDYSPSMEKWARYWLPCKKKIIFFEDNWPLWKTNCLILLEFVNRLSIKTLNSKILRLRKMKISKKSLKRSLSTNRSRLVIFKKKLACFINKMQSYWGISNKLRKNIKHIVKDLSISNNKFIHGRESGKKRRSIWMKQ